MQKNDEEVALVTRDQSKLAKEDLPAYKNLGDRKYSHCGFMKIMVPKKVRVGNNLCMCLPILMCFGICIEKRFKKISSLQNLFSIGFNVGTFHRLLGLGGFFYLLAVDFWRNDPREFSNWALRNGGMLTSSSSWLPLYTLDNAMLSEFFINPGYDTTKPALNPDLQSSWFA
jgi:hypothetical protein